ncbi:Peptide chain release factor N(5)-glutamine methyltransferase [hydrothermal vent metagenome]|uniref:peptide chain release factor N(5)-glutamine methyltransferase n=1 Tax=hydrothermal vent metagenome TaxID=652676 RepID=A0A3B1CE40_9ZZZZ
MQTVLTAEKRACISDLLEAGATFLEAHQIEAARLEAEHLLAARLNGNRLKLFLHAEHVVSETCRNGFLEDLARRAAHEPLQYIIGEVEFYGLPFCVSKGVFIPRPETELIVEEAQKLSTHPAKILDLCTGSGALAVALAVSFKDSAVTATELSKNALKIAQQNAEKNHCLSQITFLQGDLLDPLKKKGLDASGFDLIVSNPPYISEADRDTLPPEVRDYEPALALFAEDEGRAFYRRILFEAPDFLNDDGVILLELGHKQSQWLRHFIKNEINPSDKKVHLSFITDWAGIERIARIVFESGSLKNTSKSTAKEAVYG